MDRKFVKIPRRRQEAWRRAEQHSSHLHDEINIFVQDKTTQYRPRNCISSLKSQGRKRGRLEDIIAGCDFLERDYKRRIIVGSR